MTAAAAESEIQRRRRSFGEGVFRALSPYLLLAPAALVILAVLGYPLYLLTRLSFEQFGLAELITKKGTWIGADNYTRIFRDHQFWTVLLRTLVFTVVNVGLTMFLSTAIALLLVRMGPIVRTMLTVGLIWVWATPAVVGIAIWQWMVDYEFGVLNWALTKLHLAELIHYNWFDNPLTGFAVITAVVVWGAIPFAAITIYAAFTQVPQELVEAAEVDGARAWDIFWKVTVPLVKPILIIITSLSIIWDFQVLQQIWVMLEFRPSSEYYLIAVYAFVKAFHVSEYGLGAAIAVVMVLLMLAVSFVYVRQMIRISEVDA